LTSHDAECVPISADWRAGPPAQPRRDREHVHVPAYGARLCI